MKNQHEKIYFPSTWFIKFVALLFLGGTGSYIQVHINMNREKVIALVHLQEKSVPNGIDFSDKYTKIVKTKW